MGYIAQQLLATVDQILDFVRHLVEINRQIGNLVLATPQVADPHRQLPTRQLVGGIAQAGDGGGEIARQPKAHQGADHQGDGQGQPLGRA